MNKLFRITTVIIFMLSVSVLTVHAENVTVEKIDFIQNGKVVMQLADGTLSVKMTLLSESDGKDIIVAAAVYQGEQLMQTAKDEVTLRSGENVSEPLLLTNVSAENTVKAYVWEADSMRPLCETAILTKNRTDAANFYLNRYDDLVNQDNLMATAKLYDSESGGFYYTLSSKNYEPFESHLESTAQMVDYMYIAGVLNDMPTNIKNKLIQFFQERQSPEDGYFYDMRDGVFITSVRASKIGRDYDKSVAALQRLGAKPLYERGGASSAAVLSTMAVSTEDKYASVESFRAYVNQLFDSYPNNLYYVGNELVSTYSQYKDIPGYADIARSIAEERQNKTTGLWGEGKNYDALNAAMKLSGIFDKTYPFPNFEKALFSVIDIAKNDVAPTASSIWNVLDFINAAKGTYTDSTVSAVAEQAIDQNLGDLTAIILKRVSDLKQADGLYAYTENGDGTTTQGWINSLGLGEGSINGNMLCTVYMYEQAYWLYGLRTTQPLKAYAAEYFNVLAQSMPVEKQYYSADSYRMSFESEESGLRLNGATLAADPEKSGNQCLRLGGSGYIKTAVLFNETPILDRAEVGQRFYINSSDSNQYGNFELLWGQGDTATGLHIKIKKQNGEDVKLYLACDYNTAGSDIELCTLSVNQWHTLKLGYEPYQTQNLRIYVDRQIVWAGQYAYKNSGQTSFEVQKTFQQFVICQNSGSTADLFVDDMYFHTDNMPQAYALHFESDDEVSEQGLTAYRSTSAVVEDSAYSGNHYLEINNPSGSEQFGLGFENIQDYQKVVMRQRIFIRRGTNSAGTYYMYLGENDSHTALQLRFDVWYQNQTKNDVAVVVMNESNEAEVTEHLPVNQWCDFTVEYAPNEKDCKVRVYVNDVLGYEGDICYVPVNALRQIVFRKDSSSNGYLLLDDLTMIVIR